MVRGALWRDVKAYHLDLSDREVDALVQRVADQQWELVVKHGLNLDQARELTREELFLPREVPDEDEP
jgi:hypothetical protein